MAQKLADVIKLIVYDFDGVMTNNRVYIDENGKESVAVSRADGLGISEIKKMGIKQMIISTEMNKVVKKRAEKLNILCINGVDNKANELKNFVNRIGVDLSNVIFVGNDINDADVMSLVGWPMCPSDSYNSIKKISKHVFKSKGGEGVIRELFDLMSRGD